MFAGLSCADPTQAVQMSMMMKSVPEVGAAAG